MILRVISSRHANLVSRGSCHEALPRFLLGVVTPLWIGDTIGLGVGGAIGLKYSSLAIADSYNGDRSISVSRTPVEAWLQLVFPLADKWLGRFAAGVHDDLKISHTQTTASTSADVPTRSHVGFVSEFGLYRQLASHFGCGLNLRFVKVGYIVNNVEVDASNFGGEFTMHVFFECDPPHRGPRRRSSLLRSSLPAASAIHCRPCL